jgi:hypothetical protein
MITLHLPDPDAAALALLLRRLTWEDVRRRAEDERQAYAMLEAVERVRAKLESRG